MSISSSSSSRVQVLARGMYSNSYRWRRSDPEFLRSVSTGGGGGERREAAAVDSYSCRQMYLRSYIFTKRRESIAARSGRFLRMAKMRVLLPAAFYRRRRMGKGKKKKKKGRGGASVKEKFMYGSLSALRYVLRRLFSCSPSSPTDEMTDHRSQGKGWR